MKLVSISGKQVSLPDWANWIAQDEAGLWFAYKTQPTPHTTCFLQPDSDRAPARIMFDPPGKEDPPVPNPNWKATLKPV